MALTHLTKIIFRFGTAIRLWGKRQKDGLEHSPVRRTQRCRMGGGWRGAFMKGRMRGRNSLLIGLSRPDGAGTANQCHCKQLANGTPPRANKAKSPTVRKHRNSGRMKKMA